MPPLGHPKGAFFFFSRSPGGSVLALPRALCRLHRSPDVNAGETGEENAATESAGRNRKGNAPGESAGQPELLSERKAGGWKCSPDVSAGGNRNRTRATIHRRGCDAICRSGRDIEEVRIVDHSLGDRNSQGRRCAFRGAGALPAEFPPAFAPGQRSPFSPCPDPLKNPHFPGR